MELENGSLPVPKTAPASLSRDSEGCSAPEFPRTRTINTVLRETGPTGDGLGDGVGFGCGVEEEVRLIVGGGVGPSVGFGV